VSGCEHISVTTCSIFANFCACYHLWQWLGFLWRGVAICCVLPVLRMIPPYLHAMGRNRGMSMPLGEWRHRVVMRRVTKYPWEYHYRRARIQLDWIRIGGRESLHAQNHLASSSHFGRTLTCDVATDEQKQTKTQTKAPSYRPHLAKSEKNRVHYSRQAVARHQQTLTG